MNDATRLTPATFDQWMEALDRYPKTRGRLHDDKGFCCLGVLADLEGCKWVEIPLQRFRDTDRDERGGPITGGSIWSGAADGELHEFLTATIEGCNDGVAYKIAEVNDSVDSFEPVEQTARELYAQWKASQA